MPILIEKRKNKAITVKELLESMKGAVDDMTDKNHITIDSVGGKGLLDLIVLCKEENYLQLICKYLSIKHDDIKDVYTLEGDIILNNPFNDFVNVIEFKNIISELDQNCEIYLCFDDDDTLFPLTVASRCDSNDCVALHLHSMEDESDFLNISLN